jgi:hypothetical protein
VDERQLLDSFERLIAAGILADYRHNSRTGVGRLSFSPAWHRLLMAGRQPDHEPGFQRAWATGDPLAVRRWIAREAAALGADPATPPSNEAADGAGPQPDESPDA